MVKKLNARNGPKSSNSGSINEDVKKAKDISGARNCQKKLQCPGQETISYEWIEIYAYEI